MRRDSQVLWSRTLPMHWEETRAKFLFKRERRPPSDNDGVVTAFRDGEVTLRENRRSDGFTFAVKEIGYQGVRCGDLVVHSMDGFAGAIGVSDSDGKCSPVYLCCTPIEGAWPPFYAYVLRHMALSGFITSLAKGIRERSTSFGWSDFTEQVLPEPPPETQRAIADFLDRKTAAIDALIEKKERLLELLAEKRAALIHRAVTKGLDPDVPMKDSGVPWIGEIPAHWSVSRVKFLVNFTTSGSRGWSEYFTDDESCPVFLLSGNLGSDLDLDWRNVQRVDPPVGAEGQRTQLQDDDVLVCITGAKTGNVARATKLFAPTFINQHVALLRPDNSRVTGRYLACALKSQASATQLEMTQYGGTKQGLGLEHVRDVWVAVPPRREQDEQMARLESRLNRLRLGSGSVLTQLDKLREYRQALITAAVTGQLDIPGAA